MLSYTYDTRGNRVKEAYTNNSNAAENYNTTCFYDVNNRLLTERKLLTADSTGTINRYYYDKNGNQIKKTTGTYDTMRMTHQIQGAYHTTLGIYGENENSGFTTEKRTYDAFNQLTKVTGNGTALGTYTYLPNGLRLSKTVNGSTKYFLWDGDQIYAELNSNNAVTAQYLYGTERICNTINNNYYMYNNHGDVSDLTDANGNVIRNYSFLGSDAFGDEKNPDSNDTNPFRYCGEYYDTETGNIYLRARYYDPGIGSFITEDPVRDGINWYSYCMGNPVRYIDSSGMELYVNGSKDEKDELLKELSYLTDYTLNYNEDGKVFIVSDDMPDGEFYYWGNQLLDNVMDTSKKCNIYLSSSLDNPYVNEINRPSGSYVQAINESGAFFNVATGKCGVGSDVNIIFNKCAENHYVAEEYGSDIAVKCREEDSFISLAHELIHADRYMRGVALNCNNKIKNTYTYKTRNFLGQIVMKQAPGYHNLEEYVVTGLVSVNANDITENKIRKEHYIKKRLVYSIE